MQEKCQPKRIGNRFENPWDTWEGLPGISGLFKWYRTKKERGSLAQVEITLPVLRPNFESSTQPKGLVATWLGHATVLVQIENFVFLTDPVFSPRCFPAFYVGPRRIQPPPCAVADLPKIDAVLISHNHYDHLDLSSVKQLNDRFGANLTWLVPLGLRQWFLDTGCTNVVEKSWWEEHTFSPSGGDPDAGGSVKVAALPAQHWSGRSLMDKNKSLWCGWAIVGQNSRFYFAGDTGYCPAFKSIGHFYGPFTLAAIPIGCYEPRWFMKNQHIEPREAVQIHQDVGAQNSVGIHWGTYDMGSTEDIVEPKFELARQVKAAGLQPTSFFTLNQGDSWKSWAPEAN